jgi:hypothetical protein
MGDYSRSAIHTAFNTGTVVGVCSNVFTAGLTPKHIRSFSWGDARYELDKALRDINNWMHLKGRQLPAADAEVLEVLYAGMAGG